MSDVKRESIILRARLNSLGGIMTSVKLVFPLRTLTSALMRYFFCRTHELMSVVLSVIVPVVLPLICTDMFGSGSPSDREVPVIGSRSCFV